MKSTLMASVATGALLFFGTAALAGEGDRSVEATLNYGTQAYSGLEGQFGVTVGAGQFLTRNLQARADLSYLRSAVSRSGMEVTGYRIPLDLGGRYYYPVPKLDPELKLYGQAGLEISFDRRERLEMAAVTPSSDVAFGVVLGGGAEYPLSREFGASANLLYHVIEQSYLSVGAGMTYHF